MAQFNTKDKNILVVPGMLNVADGVHTYYTAAMDPMTAAQVSIDYEHHEVHEGDMFQAGGSVGVANNATYVLHILTPNTTKIAHLVYHLSSTYEVGFEFFESPTVTGNGTAVAAYNKNRSSLVAATTLVFHTPTTTGDGTLLSTRREGLGKTAGTGTRAETEWILAANKSYMFRITSYGGAGTTNYCNWRFVWYEHTAVI